MTKSPLRALAACSLTAVVLATAGCGSTKVTTGSSGMFTPQTGSILGRRLPSRQAQQSRQRAASATKAEKRKRADARKPAKRERADEDYMTRGGFR